MDKGMTPVEESVFLFFSRHFTDVKLQKKWRRNFSGKVVLSELTQLSSDYILQYEEQFVDQSK